jgi:hypothetical protein
MLQMICMVSLMSQVVMRIISVVFGYFVGCINFSENSAPTNCVRSIGVFPVSRLLRLDRSSIPSDTLAWTLVWSSVYRDVQ